MKILARWLCPPLCFAIAGKPSPAINSLVDGLERTIPVKSPRAVSPATPVCRCNCGGLSPCTPTVLGRGGFGAVYLSSTGRRRVAIKRFHRRKGSTSCASLTSFLAEASTTRLRHPNIVRVLAAVGRYEDSTSMYILMEYAGRRNLQTLIDDAGQTLGIARRLKYAMHVARALTFVHSRRLVHLDVKPANIIVTAADGCKLGDFGCSRVIEDDEEVDEGIASPRGSVELTGTCAYRAPELLRGESPTTKADVYSLGITLWQMTSRRRPYDNLHQHLIVFRVVAHQMRPSEDDDRTDSADIVDVCYRDLYRQCWHAEPAQRPTVRDLLDVVQMWRRNL